jgi:PAS domain S-box-containing protein
VREVSGNAIRGILEVLETVGLDTVPLLARLPISLETLRTSARVDWDVFIAFVEGVEELWGNRLSFEEIGIRLYDAPSFYFLRHAGRLLITPRQLYTVANRIVAPVMFSNVTVTHRWLPSGRLEMIGEIAPGYRESAAFFRLCHANVIASPRVLGLPSSVVEEEVITPRRGRMVMQLPRSLTIGAKLRRAARTVLALGDAFRVVARQQEELDGSLEALRTSRHELRQLVERLPDGVLLHRAGTVTWANAAMLDLLGLARLDQLVGRNILDFIPEEDRVALVNEMAKASPAQVAEDWREYRMLRADRQIRRVLARTVPNIELDGAPARLVVLQDVTEHHRLHEQLALGDRMASLGRLAAGVAHEINNPLAYVHTSLEVASRALAGLGDPRTVPIAESITRAQEGAERVRGIVRDLKMLSRPDDEPFEAIDLPAVLDSTLALAANAIGPRARVVRSYGKAPKARATRGRLGQLFLNLLLNAADALTEGDPQRNEIRVTTRADEAGRAVVEIADTGQGIDPALGERVFDPFFTTKEIGAGTGLGLAICHRIVTQLGGSITFESTLDQGTTFRVALPASDAEPLQPPAAPFVPSRARVLLVDDEPALLRSIEYLIGETHDVTAASSGREALDLLRRDSFDVVVADLMMPGITGMDLYQAARTEHPGLEQRFVFMTGGAFTPQSATLLASIPNRCLGKPFDEDELLRAIGEVIDERVRP